MPSRREIEKEIREENRLREACKQAIAPILGDRFEARIVLYPNRVQNGEGR